MLIFKNHATKQFLKKVYKGFIFDYYMNERGISNLVVTSLLILLSISGVFLIYSMVRNFSENSSLSSIDSSLFSEKISLSKIEFNLDEGIFLVSFIVKKELNEGQVSGLRVFLKDDTGRSIIREIIPFEINYLESKLVEVDYREEYFNDKIGFVNDVKVEFIYSTISDSPLESPVVPSSSCFISCIDFLKINSIEDVSTGFVNDKVVFEEVSTGNIFNSVITKQGEGYVNYKGNNYPFSYNKDSYYGDYLVFNKIGNSVIIIPNQLPNQQVFENYYIVLINRDSSPESCGGCKKIFKLYEVSFGSTSDYSDNSVKFIDNLNNIYVATLYSDSEGKFSFEDKVYSFFYQKGDLSTGIVEFIDENIDRLQVVAKNSFFVPEESLIEQHLPVCSSSDINGDGWVGIGDLTLLATHYGENLCSFEDECCSRTDINGDGIVSIGDLVILNGQFNSNDIQNCKLPNLPCASCSNECAYEGELISCGNSMYNLCGNYDNDICLDKGNCKYMSYTESSLGLFYLYFSTAIVDHIRLGVDPYASAPFQVTSVFGGQIIYSSFIINDYSRSGIRKVNVKTYIGNSIYPYNSNEINCELYSFSSYICDDFLFTIPSDINEDYLNVRVEVEVENNFGIVSSYIYEEEFEFEKIENDLCKELISNHNDLSMDRANFVFIGEGFERYNGLDTSQFIRDIALSFIEFREDNKNSLFSISPFKGNEDKFNFWYIDKNIEKDKFYCSNGFCYDLSGYTQACRFNNIYTTYLLGDAQLGNAYAYALPYSGTILQKIYLGRQQSSILEEGVVLEKNCKNEVEFIPCFSACEEGACITDSPLEPSEELNSCSDLDIDFYNYLNDRIFDNSYAKFYPNEMDIIDFRYTSDGDKYTLIPIEIPNLETSFAVARLQINDFYDSRVDLRIEVEYPYSISGQGFYADLFYNTESSLYEGITYFYGKPIYFSLKPGEISRSRDFTLRMSYGEGSNHDSYGTERNVFYCDFKSNCYETDANKDYPDGKNPYQKGSSYNLLTDIYFEDECVEDESSIYENIEFRDGKTISLSSGNIQVFKHELGHSFGKLDDEYIRIGGGPSSTSDIGLNCFIPSDGTRNSCLREASWKYLITPYCEDPSDIECISCFEGCTFEKGVFRSVFEGLMKNSQRGKEYGLWNENLIKKEIIKFSGGKIV